MRIIVFFIFLKINLRQVNILNKTCFVRSLQLEKTSMPEDIRHVEITLRTVTALKAIIEDIASSLSGKVLRAVMQNFQK